MTKLLMIALDGATLDLLDPWMAEGKLPLLARLFSEGSGGRLRSSVPWATPTAFATFATGTNPGKHGVFDFGQLTGHDYTRFVPTNGSNIRGRTLWRLFSDAGLSVGVVNMPMTYPAEAVNGFLIAGIPYPSGSARLCYPPDLHSRLRQRGWDLSLNASDDLGGSYASYYNGLTELVRTRAAAAAWLLQRFHPDFAAIHFLETDQVQHRFWQFLPGEPRYAPDGAFTNGILRLFQESERALTRIIEAAGEGATLCIMSDHGFGPTRQQVWLNNWLVDRRLMVLKPSAGIRLKKLLYRLGLSPAAIREAAPERLKLAILQFFERQKGRALASTLEAESDEVRQRGLLDRLTERLAIDFYDVDWSRTRAFSTGTTSVGYVWINRSDRDPQGIVRPGQEYRQVREEIAEALRRWKPVGEVCFREELWHGSAIDEAPDIIVKWADLSTDARYFQTRFSSHLLAKEVPNDYAGHRPDGMFLLHGPSVTPGQTLEADILDLAPTFLWLLDQPVPSNMDGRVLTECFTVDHPVRKVKAETEEPTTSGGLTDEDEEAIKDTLRGLGYIE